MWEREEERECVFVRNQHPHSHIAVMSLMQADVSSGTFPFSIVDHKGMPVFRVAGPSNSGQEIGTQLVTPQDVGAAVLKTLRATAEKVLGGPITQVSTVNGSHFTLFVPSLFHCLGGFALLLCSFISIEMWRWPLMPLILPYVSCAHFQALAPFSTRP
jgi:hypothetical protein